MPRIVHLSTAHPWHDTRIFHKECQTLAQAGYEVILVAPHDRDENLNGVRVRGLPKPVGRRDRLLHSARQAYRAAIQEDATVYHFHDPELIGLGLLLKARGKRVIYDVHEDLPRQIQAKGWIRPGLRGIIACAAGVMEHVAGLACDRIVAATPTIARRFPRHKTITVCNFPIVVGSDGAWRRPYAQREPLVIYVGTLGISRGTQEMLQAMEFLPKSTPARLELAGVFHLPDEREACERLAGSRSTFLGWLSQEAVKDLMSRAKVGLVTLHPTQSYLDSYPVKLFEYMRAAVPVVASDFPLWRDIVAGTGCGLLVDPMSPTAIAEAIEWLLRHPRDAEEMGKRGCEAVCSSYNWRSEAAKLASLYDGLLRADERE